MGTKTVIMVEKSRPGRRPELKLYQQGYSKRTDSRHNFKAELTEVRDLWIRQMRKNLRATRITVVPLIRDY